MAWVPPIETIRKFYATGAGDMGDATIETGFIARFSMPDVERYVLVGFRVHFRAGSGTSTLTLNLRSDRSRTNETTGSSTAGGAHDVRLIDFPKKGTSADLNFMVTEGDYEAWTFDCGDELVFSWTDPGTTLWGIEIMLAPAPSPVAA